MQVSKADRPAFAINAAAAAGVHVTWEKLKITLLSAAMTAFAGALYCQYHTNRLNR
jgi:ABC-type branched-subunit amino acid transport system permease subunit